jgi:hypothetical protein
MGGLGNQMFQAAHALAQTWRQNVESKFKAESWTPMQGRQTSNYTTNVFRKLNFVNDLGHVGRVSEGPWEYSEINPLWDQPQEFYGYFQSSKNFLGFDKKIQEVFEPTDEFISEMYEKYPQLKNENTLSIHVRRGDCFMNPDIGPRGPQNFKDIYETNWTVLDVTYKDGWLY